MLVRVFVFLFRAGGRGGVARQGVRQVEREESVAALGGAILHHIFPLFFVVIFLLLAPGLAGRKVNGLRIRRPRKRVDLFFALGDSKGFAAAGRDQIDLRGLAFRIRIRVGVRIGVIAACGQFAFGEKRDPLAVGRPLRLGVVAGLRQLNQRAGLAVVAIEPEVLAEDLLVPIGAFGNDDDRMAVGRNLYRREADGVEEFVEREFGFALRGDGECATQDDCKQDYDSLDSHRAQMGRRVIQRRVGSRQICEF